VVAVVFSFVYAWGDLIFGLTFIVNPLMRPITSSIYNYVQQYQTLWNSTMAFGIIAIFPVVLIFIFMQRYIVSGLTNGAVKG
jgi:multiple sugar transport system permease protein